MSDAASIARDFVRHRHALLAFLRAAVPDPHTAEDLFQEVCLVAIRKAAEFEDGTDFAAWARAIARHKVREHLRVRRGIPVDDAFFDALEAAFARPAPDAERRREALRLCLAGLQDHARRVLGLRYEEGLAPADIAARTGGSRASVNSLLQRTRELLRECVARRFAGEART